MQLKLGPQASRLPGTESGVIRGFAGETPAVPGEGYSEPLFLQFPPPPVYILPTSPPGF